MDAESIMDGEKDRNEAAEDSTEVTLGLPFSVAQALVDYFVQRPYREAAPFINALQSLRPVAPSGAE